MMKKNWKQGRDNNNNNNNTGRRRKLTTHKHSSNKLERENQTKILNLKFMNQTMVFFFSVRTCFRWWVKFTVLPLNVSLLGGLDSIWQGSEHWWIFFIGAAIWPSKWMVWYATTTEETQFLDWLMFEKKGVFFKKFDFF
jgi:hypothetical protein